MDLNRIWNVQESTNIPVCIPECRRFLPCEMDCFAKICIFVNNMECDISIDGTRAKAENTIEYDVAIR